MDNFLQSLCVSLPCVTVLSLMLSLSDPRPQRAPISLNHHYPSLHTANHGHRQLTHQPTNFCFGFGKKAVSTWKFANRIFSRCLVFPQVTMRSLLPGTKPPVWSCVPSALFTQDVSRFAFKFACELFDFACELCEHFHWALWVPIYAFTCCEVLCLLCERSLRPSIGIEPSILFLAC